MFGEIMSGSIRSDTTDDPEFVALIERIAVRSFKQGDYEEVFIIEIKNWFDHKWLKFSGIGRVPFHSVGDDHPQVALDEFFQDKITFPPFTPNRILRQQWHPADQSRSRWLPYSRKLRRHSSWNLQRRVTQYAGSALFVWFSSGTKTNDRGSLMLYQVHAGSVSAWYASFRKATGWVLHLTKGITREVVESLMEKIAEQGAASNGGPATPLGNSDVTEGPPSVS
jgi:hypothetical protein